MNNLTDTNYEVLARLSALRAEQSRARSHLAETDNLLETSFWATQMVKLDGWISAELASLRERGITVPSYLDDVAPCEISDDDLMAELFAEKG